MQRQPMGGVGRILANMVPLLAEHVDLELLTDASLPHLDAGLPEHALRTPPPGHAALWLQWSAPRWLAKNRVDLFHCPWYGLPFRQPVPMVVTIHDLTFEHHPEWFSRAHQLTYRTQARHAARTARAILTVSEHVRVDIMSTYNVASERLHVVPSAIDPVFGTEKDPTAVLARLGVTSPYLVALGGAPRRNLATAVAAWREVRRTGSDISLVVTGPPEATRPEHGLYAAPALSDDDWSAVLTGAEALIYPTSDEGFGMPGLEAIASGTPVVCAAVGALPEVLGDAAEWCATPTAADIAAGLRRLLTNPARHHRLREAGLIRAAAAPGWTDATALTVAAYQAALASH
jgi:alpha-1,3-rhamnosyl/mannosyltransferase